MWFIDYGSEIRCPCILAKYTFANDKFTIYIVITEMREYMNILSMVFF